MASNQMMAESYQDPISGSMKPIRIEAKEKIGLHRPSLWTSSPSNLLIK